MIHNERSDFAFTHSFSFLGHMCANSTCGGVLILNQLFLIDCCDCLPLNYPGIKLSNYFYGIAHCFLI